MLTSTRKQENNRVTCPQERGEQRAGSGLLPPNVQPKTLDAFTLRLRGPQKPGAGPAAVPLSPARGQEETAQFTDSSPPPHRRAPPTWPGAAGALPTGGKEAPAGPPSPSVGPWRSWNPAGRTSRSRVSAASCLSSRAHLPSSAVPEEASYTRFPETQDLMMSYRSAQVSTENHCHPASQRDLKLDGKGPPGTELTETEQGPTERAKQTLPSVCRPPPCDHGQEAQQGNRGHRAKGTCQEHEQLSGACDWRAWGGLCCRTKTRKPRVPAEREHGPGGCRLQPQAWPLCQHPNGEEGRSQDRDRNK